MIFIGPQAQDVLRGFLKTDLQAADVSRIHIMNMVCQADKNGETEEMMFQLGHLAELEEAIQSIPALRLVVIDPVGSFIGGRTDAHRDNEVRAVLAPVAQLAEQSSVAMLVVAHNRKGASTTSNGNTNSAGCEGQK